MTDHVARSRPVEDEGGRPAGWRPPDWRRLLQLGLATLWLLDGVLQLQPFMFTSGPHGFSAMLAASASGNPHSVAQTITWNASFVGHHAVATDSVFATIQVLLGLGIAWRPTLKAALGASVVWSLAVWWFGEGLGGMLHGDGSPIAGGPGAVLFYALLAVLLWPTDRSELWPSFVAGRAVGATAARAIWTVVWMGLSLLSLIGSGRAPQGVHDVITNVNSGEPGWLAAVDRQAASLVANRGLAVALVFSAICLIVAVGVYLPIPAMRAVLVLAIVTSVVIWVVGQDFGTILAGGATDPNSGLLLVLVALAYWPTDKRTSASFDELDHHEVTPSKVAVA